MRVGMPTASLARFISRLGFLSDLLIILLSGPLRFTTSGTGAAVMEDHEYAEILRHVMDGTN